MRASCLIALVCASAVPHVAMAQERVPVPRATIYPGEVIVGERLQLIERPTERGIASTYGEVEGRIARRTLLADQPIPLGAVREPDAVKQGHQVKLIYEHGAVVITGVATALQSGRVGAHIGVQSADSGLVIRGRVLEPGVVGVARE